LDIDSSIADELGDNMDTKIFGCSCGEIFITDEYHKVNFFAEETSTCPTCGKICEVQVKTVSRKIFNQILRENKWN
jgi:hypothetical protein